MTGAAPSRDFSVALLSPCFWPEVRRGTERLARELADGLMRRGHRPSLITSHPGPTTRTVEEGLPIVRHWRPPDGRLRQRGFEDYLTHVPFSYLSLRRGAPEIAHAFYPTDALAAARWSRVTGRPSVLTYMGIPDHPGVCARRYRLEITQRAVEGCTAVTALSRTAADAFRRWLGAEARVVYPGVDMSAFRIADGRAEVPTIFCAAPLEVPRKRVPLLIAAFGHLRRARPQARLVLLRPGDPTEADRLERTAGIELVDPVEASTELAPHYARAWLSVLPSVEDSFGIVLIESLACGTPVVATNSHALPEVVDRDGIGRLFDGDDPEALARTVLEALELAEDPATSAACRSRAEDFSTERCVDAYEALYRELLDGR